MVMDFFKILQHPTRDKNKRALSLMLPIFGSHVRRLGWIRPLVAGSGMYWFFPFLVLIHGLISWLVYPCLFQVIVDTKRLSPKKYIIIDRYKIHNLAWFDRFNCVYCGYANGVAMLLNAQLDQLNTSKMAISTKAILLKQLLLSLLCILCLPVMLLLQLAFELFYTLIIARSLGFETSTFLPQHRRLLQQRFASHYPFVIRYYLLVAKNLLLRLNQALKHIESAWCPLYHLEQNEGVVYPDHHRYFFSREQIHAMRETLCQRGSVLPPS